MTKPVAPVRLPADDLDALRAIAARRGTNVSVEMRRAVRRFRTAETRRLGL